MLYEVITYESRLYRHATAYPAARTQHGSRLDVMHGIIQGDVYLIAAGCEIAFYDASLIYYRVLDNASGPDVRVFPDNAIFHLCEGSNHHVISDAGRWHNANIRTFV